MDRMSPSFTSHIIMKDVYYSFQSGASSTHVLKNVNLAIGAGEFVIVTGPSGSGKTTLLTLISGLRSPQAGSISVLGLDLNQCSSSRLRNLRLKIGVVYQQPNLIDFLTVQQNLIIAQEAKGVANHLDRYKTALFWLDLIGLANKKDHYPSMLSGGQMQKLSFARAMVNEPLLIVADEPTASLDSSSASFLVDLMKDVCSQRNVTVVFSTHDARLWMYGDRLINVIDGCVS